VWQMPRAFGQGLSRSAQNFVFPEPCLHLIPGVFGGFLAVACSVVGVEAVRRAGIDLELGGLVRLRQRSFQRLDLGDGNAGIRASTQAGAG